MNYLKRFENISSSHDLEKLNIHFEDFFLNVSESWHLQQVDYNPCMNGSLYITKETPISNSFIEWIGNCYKVWSVNNSFMIQILFEVPSVSHVDIVYDDEAKRMVDVRLRNDIDNFIRRCKVYCKEQLGERIWFQGSCGYTYRRCRDFSIVECMIRIVPDEYQADWRKKKW